MNMSSLVGKPLLMTFGLGSNANDAEFMPEKELKALIAQRISAFG
jgi:hypothetical protein